MCEVGELLISKHTAMLRWEAGEVPCFSSDYVGELTCGYGQLSEYGEWEFPLYPAERYLGLVKTNSLRNKR